jgi:5-methyltetrahydropteroyltriglutamate--homocysteine methyltransferase
MRNLSLFPVTMVGSWPRPIELLRLQKKARAGKVNVEEFNLAAEKSILNILQIQETAGLDIVTDGEQRRDNFYSFVADKLDGVQLKTMSEMLEVIEDKAGFERILQTLDVPAYSLSNPCCVGKIERRESIASRELKFLKSNTDKAIKIPLPGPYLLTRAMYVPELSKCAYKNKEDLAEDVIRILREEILELIEAGVDFIQFDEPVLTEVVFTQGQTRTFMCASLSAKGDPAEELEFALELINRVIDGIDGCRFGLHICRGNWSQNETILLEGNYSPLADYLSKIKVDQLVLEYATKRAGDVIPIPGKELGLGVVNPRLENLESVDEICNTIENALKCFEPENIFLNPDCGFGTFSNSPVNSSTIAGEKLERMVAAAVKMRAKYKREGKRDVC